VIALIDDSCVLSNYRMWRDDSLCALDLRGHIQLAQSEGVLYTQYR